MSNNLTIKDYLNSSNVTMSRKAKIALDNGLSDEEFHKALLELKDNNEISDDDINLIDRKVSRPIKELLEDPPFGKLYAVYVIVNGNFYWYDKDVNNEPVFTGKSISNAKFRHNRKCAELKVKELLKISGIEHANIEYSHVASIK